EKAGLFAGMCKACVFGKKTVTGMNRDYFVFARQRDDVRDIEISSNRLTGLADGVGLVRLEAMEREAVLVGVDSHGADTELMRRPENANGNFATIGDQQLR